MRQIPEFIRELLAKLESSATPRKPPALELSLDELGERYRKEPPAELSPELRKQFTASKQTETAE